MPMAAAAHLTLVLLALFWLVKDLHGRIGFRSLSLLGQRSVHGSFLSGNRLKNVEPFSNSITDLDDWRTKMCVIARLGVLMAQQESGFNPFLNRRPS